MQKLQLVIDKPADDMVLSGDNKLSAVPSVDDSELLNSLPWSDVTTLHIPILINNYITIIS